MKDTGTVKWFNDDKGYGFIISPQYGDVFIHYSNILGRGHRTLYEGDAVEFEIEQTEKGIQAINASKM